MEVLELERRRLERMKGSFLALTSHELRTPLAIARLAIGLAEERALCPEVRRAAETAAAAMSRLEARIEDILLFSRLAGGDLIRGPVELGALLREACGRHVELVAERRIDAVVFPCSRKVDLQADAQALTAAFSHLYGNALRFTPVGGVVRVVLEADRAHAYLRLRDSAPPVPPEEREAIFGGFYQASDPLTRVHGGLGLGLALARRALEAHGGALTLEAGPGGNVFCARLPLA